jgi:hypothetical protein
MGHGGLLQRYIYFLYAGVVRTSYETYLWNTTACYRDGFTFYMRMMFVPHTKDYYGTPRAVMGLALLFKPLYKICDRLCGLVVRVPGC